MQERIQKFFTTSFIIFSLAFASFGQAQTVSNNALPQSPPVVCRPMWLHQQRPTSSHLVAGRVEPLCLAVPDAVCRGCPGVPR
jgi:hypothetical protein